MSKYCAAVVHPDCENEPYCGAPMPCAKHAKREPVPLSDEEIARRQVRLVLLPKCADKHGHVQYHGRWHCCLPDAWVLSPDNSISLLDGVDDMTRLHPLFAAAESHEQRHYHAMCPVCRRGTPEVGQLFKCLICALDKPWGAYDAATGAAVCVDCRDAARSGSDRIDHLTKQLAEHHEQNIRIIEQLTAKHRHVETLERQLAEIKERADRIADNNAALLENAAYADRQLAERDQRENQLLGEITILRNDAARFTADYAAMAATLAERDRQLAESHGRADKLAKALGIYGNHDQTVYCPAAFNPHNDCACGFTLTLLLAERTKG